MTIKLCHLADTHIKNLKYHEEYKEVFQRIYETLKQEKVDYIVHCGDIAHTKTQISPEFVELCSDFFRNLAEIAPTYIILGNHDGNLRNPSRQDALTPIVDALSIPNLVLVKNSSKVALNDSCVLNVLSVFDTGNWDLELDPAKINIALYHGAVRGAVTDVGYMIEHGDVDMQTLRKFDYALLGDIHKTNQKLDKEGRIRYAGSTIQQNFGETDDKGFLIWDIESKKDFKVRHFCVKNPKPFVTINLTPKGRIPKGTEMAPGARLRLVADTNLPIDAQIKATNVAKSRFKPESVSFLNRAATRHVERQDSEAFHGNLRDLNVQEELIRNYLEEYEVDETLMSRILELNKSYNSMELLEQDGEQLRNVNWKLKSMSWDNLFNFGEDNSINFENLNGIVGIFGKNFSGKSSIVDSFLLGLFNSSSKSFRKNLGYINQNKGEASVCITADLNGKQYAVERKLEKYVKKLKGKVTDEARVDLDFYCTDPVTGEIESLNGSTRAHTDSNVRKHFGSLEDFLITNMSSQHGALQFINEGSSKRKEILARFLDLDILDRKFKIAKEDSLSLKHTLKELEKIDYDKKIFGLDKDIILHEATIRDRKDTCKKWKAELEALKVEKSLIDDKISSVPAKIIDIEKAKKNMNKLKKSLRNSEEKKQQKEVEREENKQIASQIQKFLKEADIEGCRQKKELLLKTTKSLEIVSNSVKQVEIKRRMEEKKVSLLGEVPCGEEFSHCKFIKDAYAAKGSLETHRLALAKLEQEMESLESEMQALEPAKIEELIEKHDKLRRENERYKSNVTKNELSISKEEQEIARLSQQVAECEEAIAEYERNKEAIENLSRMTKQSNVLNSKIVEMEKKLTECEAEYLKLHMVMGTLQEKLDETKKQKAKRERMQGDFAAYHLFMTCFHPSGISYEIIKKKLPVINNEIQGILANIVDFKIFFENDEKKLNILIKHPKYNPRPLEMGSGAEKSIAAMAIRLALLNVTNLPKGDIFILDEPGTALDETNLEGFTRIVDLIRSYFKTVLLISHMDSLKDIVDTTINIEKCKGHAKVNQ